MSGLFFNIPFKVAFSMLILFSLFLSCKVSKTILYYPVTTNTVAKINNQAIKISSYLHACFFIVLQPCITWWNKTLLGIKLNKTFVFLLLKGQKLRFIHTWNKTNTGCFIMIVKKFKLHTLAIQAVSLERCTFPGYF